MYKAEDTKRQSKELLELAQREVVEIQCASPEETSQVYNRLNVQRFRLKLKGMKIRFSRPECWVRMSPMSENADITAVSENLDTPEVEDEQVVGDGEAVSGPGVPGPDARGSKEPRRRKSAAQDNGPSRDETHSERADDDDGSGDSGVHGDVHPVVEAALNNEILMEQVIESHQLEEAGVIPAIMTADEYQAIGKAKPRQKKVEPERPKVHPADDLFTSQKCKERGKCFCCGLDLMRSEPGYNMDHYHSKRHTTPAVVDVCCVCVGHETSN